MREKPRRKPCARAFHRGSCPSRRAVSCTVASIRSSWQSNVEPSSKSIAKRKTPAAPEGTKVADSERHGYARKIAPKTMRARVSSWLVSLSRGDCEHSDKLAVERGAVKEFDPNTLAFWWG